MKLHEAFLARMRDATQLLKTEGPAAATAAIRRALQGAPTEAPLVDINPAPAAPARHPRQAPPPHQPGRHEDGGRFLSASCTGRAGTRAYKLYVPAGYHGQALPLVVMLHGCKQDPDDFAAGTGMNRVAEANNCFVAYPEQTKRANGSNCWNWFKRGDQQREQGEPSIIADITRDIVRQYHIEPSQVYVAGLSAGGAMAAIMGAGYPELYAAVGVHSGLPVGAAHDVPSAFSAMGNGAAKVAAIGNRPIPAIVFHGDRDTTVNPRNGEQVLAQYAPGTDAQAVVQEGQVPQGRSYTTTIRRNADGAPVAEKWIVHGAGHAWSGGHPEGSYTDRNGPDASKEMMRFFLQHRNAAQ